MQAASLWRLGWLVLAVLVLQSCAGRDVPDPQAVSLETELEPRPEDGEELLDEDGEEIPPPEEYEPLAYAGINYSGVSSRQARYKKSADLQSFAQRAAASLSRMLGWNGEVYSVTLLDSGAASLQLRNKTTFYITRGMLALINSEAELAALMAHEVRHQFLGHKPRARQRPLAASLAADLLDARRRPEEGLDINGLDQLQSIRGYTAQEEAQVDEAARSDMEAMGYEPSAYADVFANLRELTLSGFDGGRERAATQAYTALHPISSGRVEELRAEMGELAVRPDDQAYLAAIDKTIYGERLGKRFARRGVYVNQSDGYSFRVPPNFTLKIVASGAVGIGPKGARFAFDTVKNPSGVATDEYVTARWLAAVDGATLNTADLAGRPAAQALRKTAQTQTRLVAITAIKGRVHRFKMSAPKANWAESDIAFRRIVRSFRFLNEHELDALDPLRVHVFTARAGDTVVSLARRMSVRDQHERRFRILNGLAKDSQLRVGQKVKLVR